MIVPYETNFCQVRNERSLSNERRKHCFNSEDVQNNKVMGILAYFGILFLIPLLAAKDSQYARFHTNQGIVLFIFSVALNIIGNGISFVISVTSFGILSFVGTLITGLIGLVCLAFAIVGIVNACSGEPKKLPIIGSITLYK